MSGPEINMINSEGAVSETIGYSFILGIVIIAVGILVVIAFPIQSEIQNTAFVESQIQSLTLLDSRISSVALGTTPSQLTRINLNGGLMNVRNETDNHLRVKVANESGFNITVFNDSLGLIEYKLGDTKLIYENGGMFRIYPNGESVMLSPPELYYNGETLTFPVIRIANSGSVGGKGTVSVIANSGEEPKIIYPNLSSSLLFNPIYGKQIMIRLKSENYKAWARYIRERTDAIPGTDDINKEVVVTFNSQPSEKAVELRVPIELFALDTTNRTPLTQFYFNLSNVTSSYNMVLRAPMSESPDFVMELEKSGGAGTTGMTIFVSYNKGGYNETWKSDTIAIINDNITSINLLNSSAFATYESNTQSGTWSDETPPYNKTFTKFPPYNGPVSLAKLLQHYATLVTETGTFALYPGTGTGDPAYPSGFNTTGSTYALTYVIKPPNINYLHIVNHAVNITFY